MGNIEEILNNTPGYQNWLQFRKNCKNAVEVQKKFLSELLEDNKNTEYGKLLGFDKINSIKDFKKRVPFSNYDTYAPYIERMLNGEQNLMTVYPVVHYSKSSGSVGNPKLIPATDRTLMLYANYAIYPVTILMERYLDKKYDRPLKRGCTLLTAVVSHDVLPSGITKGTISGAILNKIKDVQKKIYPGPEEITFSNEKQPFKYLKSLFNLKEENITSFLAPFTTALYDIMCYIEKNWRQLVEDIETGRLSESENLSEELKEKYQRQLRPDPVRAAKLREEFEKGFDTPICSRIWPNLEYINSIGAGGFKVYTEKLRRYTGEVPMYYMSYAASEGMFAVATEIESMEYTLIPDSNFYEFIPIDEKEECDDTLCIDELTVGKDYEIVITNVAGLYRYRIGDVVRILGYDGKCPKVVFRYRMNQMVSIAGEKTTADMIDWVKDQINKKMNTNITEYSIFADNDTNPGRYVLFIEPSEHIAYKDTEKYSELVDALLSEANPSYGIKIKDGTLSKARVVFVQKETYLLYREVMIMRGISENQIKPVRIIDNPFKEKFFFGLED